MRVPLTASEFLHPKVGYHLPNSTFHDRITVTTRDILTRRYANRSDVAVFRDLLVEWNRPDLGDHALDIAVVFGIQDPGRDRSRFIEAEEGGRPAFILEVVSPRYRREDREIKVVEYAQAQVQEYVIVDRRMYRGQLLDEVLGYQLVSGHYQPLTPDEEGRISCETVGLWISLRDGQLVMEDMQTGEQLKTSQQLEAENEALKTQLEQLQAQLQGGETQDASSLSD